MRYETRGITVQKVQTNFPRTDMTKACKLSMDQIHEISLSGIIKIPLHPQQSLSDCTIYFFN